MVKGLKEKEKVRGVLNKLVSKEIAEETLKGHVQLGGEEKHVTVFFADIRHFTAMTEKMDPKQVIKIVNKCMTKVSNLIDQRGGVIDKYVGDEVMALFGAPIQKENSVMGSGSFYQGIAVRPFPHYLGGPSQQQKIYRGLARHQARTGAPINPSIPSSYQGAPQINNTAKNVQSPSAYNNQYGVVQPAGYGAIFPGVQFGLGGPSFKSITGVSGPYGPPPALLNGPIKQAN